ncbi:DUF3408 domain-containing protein [Phocaeicola dorei]|nr:DUF3408 domain-containing protein [Phocaeicola dorei]
MDLVRRNRRRKAVLPDSKYKKTPDGAADSDEYRSRFLKVKLSGARRQTYINDTLYRTVAKVLLRSLHRKCLSPCF